MTGVSVVQKGDGSICVSDSVVVIVSAGADKSTKEIQVRWSYKVQNEIITRPITTIIYIRLMTEPLPFIFMFNLLFLIIIIFI